MYNPKIVVGERKGVGVLKVKSFTLVVGESSELTFVTPKALRKAGVRVCGSDDCSWRRRGRFTWARRRGVGTTGVGGVGQTGSGRCPGVHRRDTGTGR